MHSINLAPTVSPVAAGDFISISSFILNIIKLGQQLPIALHRELINVICGCGFIVLGGPLA